MEGLADLDKLRCGPNDLNVHPRNFALYRRIPPINATGAGTPERRITTTATPGMPDTPRNRGDHDAAHMSPVTPGEDAQSIMLNKISWGAVLVGVVVALVLQLLLNLLGLGIGAASLTAVGGDNHSAQTFSIEAGLWWTLCGVIASFAGALRGGPALGKAEGEHGGLAWADVLGVHDAGHLLPAVLDGWRRARRRLQLA
ncbi:hypothetical protein FHR71_003992 [Methylobacterium sp. RAS18]|nr:hypothetical protein [Methylobacterium sp. RAS18]